MSIACNTSALQAFSLQGSRESVNVPFLVRQTRDTEMNNLLNSRNALNIAEVVNLWFFLTAAVVDLTVPTDRVSFLLRPSLGTAYSSIKFAYDGTFIFCHANSQGQLARQRRTVLRTRNGI